jgi:hypothetical protein
VFQICWQTVNLCNRGVLLSRESHHDTLLKVQRTLAAWVDAVAQPADETRLLQQVCDPIVGYGLSRMAWFGYARDSARRIGEPVALVGDDDGFLDEFKLATSHDDYEDPAYISGRMDSKNIAELKSRLGAKPRAKPSCKSVVLELKNITLAGRDGIDFLARCEAADIKLSNWPPSIREWITRQRKKEGDHFDEP